MKMKMPEMPEPPDYGKLEEELREPYSLYQLEPSRRNATTLLKALQPAMDRGIRAHVGTSASPVMRSHARQIALKAVKSYDPQRARLSTHVINHLQGLRRVSRQQQQVMKVPERVVLDQRYLHDMAAEYEEKYGREPTTSQLADFARVPVKRIEYVRRYQPAMSGGQVQGRIEGGGEIAGFAPAVQSDAAHKAWIEAVYHDLNSTDQLIMEMTLGLHGKRPRSNQEIASRLRITPGAVSQRKLKIQAMLDREAELSPFG